MDYLFYIGSLLLAFGIGAATQFVASRLAIKQEKRKENTELFARKISFIERMMEKSEGIRQR